MCANVRTPLKLISGLTDEVSAAEALVSGSISCRFKPNTVHSKNNIFPVFMLALSFKTGQCKASTTHLLYREW